MVNLRDSEPTPPISSMHCFKVGAYFKVCAVWMWNLIILSENGENSNQETLKGAPFQGRVVTVPRKAVRWMDFLEGGRRVYIIINEYSEHTILSTFQKVDGKIIHGNYIISIWKIFKPKDIYQIFSLILITVKLLSICTSVVLEATDHSNIGA